MQMAAPKAQFKMEKLLIDKVLEKISNVISYKVRNSTVK